MFINIFIIIIILIIIVILILLTSSYLGRLSSGGTEIRGRGGWEERARCCNILYYYFVFGIFKLRYYNALKSNRYFYLYLSPAEWDSGGREIRGTRAREKREGGQESAGLGWLACLTLFLYLYLCLKVFVFVFESFCICVCAWIFLYLGARWDRNCYLDWKVGGRRDGERGRGFGQLLTSGIWNQE